MNAQRSASYWPCFKRFCNTIVYILELLRCRCYVLNSTGAGQRVPAPPLDIEFRPSQKHTVYLHDPDMFLISGNPLAVPRDVLKTNNKSGRLNVYIDVTEHRRFVKGQVVVHNRCVV